MKKGRAKRNTKRIGVRILSACYDVFEADAIAKGYVKSSGLPSWGGYFEAIATGVAKGYIGVPKKNAD